ncbi:nuclear transport factor 2 family protein [Saccharopolyspora oryzae]|uniref:Nuclear transport factor 2 family protein n=1 Tax=Saccharopolyspora oryzae TaxID=2997343 RepID=A0ABT4V940_9PSEU|nr:nuclear transport factor 2 family protein [Saccharopolyspora oryzae]MDA3630471.1 nuclear transport factor 2 family protein [Saccharopolyspora oryzae]
MARQRAQCPEDLNRLVLERLNAGDVDGLVELYEPDAVLATPAGPVVGHVAIRAAYEQIVAGSPQFAPGAAQPPVRNGDLALTSVLLAGGGATVEVARRQPDGSWRWIIDQPNLGA